MSVTPREIGEPERRGAGDGFPFRYQPAYSGTYTGLDVRVIVDRTEADVTTTVFSTPYTVSMGGGVISSPIVIANSMRPEVMYRVHFRFTAEGVPYDEFRRVVIER